MYIAPPFTAEHDVNVRLDRVVLEEMEVNSNTPPFPASLLIVSNVFVSVKVSDLTLTDISGISEVEYGAVHEMDIE